MSSDTLQKALDDTAIKLLQKASGEDTDGELLVEQVKAFSAAVDWFKVRAGHAPPEVPKETKFAGIKRIFSDDGSQAERPRGRGRPKGSGRPPDAGTVVEFPGSPDSTDDGADSA